MFKLSSYADTFLLPVKDVPMANDKGQKVKVSMSFVCKRLPRDQVLDIWKRVQPVFPALGKPAAAPAAPADGIAQDGTEGDAPEPRKQMSDDEVIDEVVVGFGRDIVDDSCAPLEWNPENKAAVFALHPVTECTVGAFFDYYMKAGRKN